MWSIFICKESFQVGLEDTGRRGKKRRDNRKEDSGGQDRKGCGGLGKHCRLPGPQKFLSSSFKKQQSMSLLVCQGPENGHYLLSSVLVFVAALALGWSRKNDSKVTWQNYSLLSSFWLFSLEICVLSSFVYFYLDGTRLLDGFFSQKPPPRKAAIFSPINPAHQRLLAESGLGETK